MKKGIILKVMLLVSLGLGLWGLALKPVATVTAQGSSTPVLSQLVYLPLISKGYTPPLPTPTPTL
jgi:hypothetical protein